jgi:predicted enzyme related to lactoylglutathione lyase
MKAKLIHVEVRTSPEHKDATVKFYSQLFEQQLARSFTDDVESYHLPISRDGSWLSVNVLGGAVDDDLPIVCHFAVDDLDAAVEQLTGAGATTLTETLRAEVAEPAQEFVGKRLAASAGHSGEPVSDFITTAYLNDPAGNTVALSEVAAPFRPWFGLHEPTLTDDQIEDHHHTVQAGEQFAAGKPVG